MKFLCLICAETLIEQMDRGARIGCVEVRPIAEDARTLRVLGLVAPDSPR
jgi:hypothetical protein